MLPTTIRTPPAIADFIPLAEYQSQTPESFADSKPVLHLHLANAQASVPKSQAGKLAVFPADGSATTDSTGEEIVQQNVAVFVTSSNFTIFSTEAETGVTIPYPSISIHAIKQVTPASEGGPTQAVWMQVEISDGGANDDDFGTVELTITPPTAAEGEPSTASQLYEAVANCSNLHPDPENEDDEEEGDYYDRIVIEGSAEHEALEGFTGVMRGATDGGLPPPMPGSGGWITADNVHEYFDAEGNWIGPEDEGEGDGEEAEGTAGRVRPRDEAENGEVNGHSTEADAENKRQRVE